MLEALNREANLTLTENGAVTCESTLSDCLDLFGTIGALRAASEDEIVTRFARAFAEDADTAMKILFFGRDVRGGLGERRVFRVLVNWLAAHEPAALRKNIALIPEYGRFDDLLALLGTACEPEAVALIRKQLWQDLAAGDNVSLLGKWLPSVNASSRETVRLARRLAHALGMSEAQYRRTVVALRQKIRILENALRCRDYSFDYAKQPSRALFKYRRAFARNDGERYEAFLTAVNQGEAVMHTGTLMPYDIIRPCFSGYEADAPLSDAERASMDTTWQALENFTDGENALVVVDGSGSMYGGGDPLPITVALSLGIYFAGRNTGAFRDRFITFSETPQLVTVKGRDIAEKVRYCASYNEVANTDLAKVFELILHTAVEHHMPQAELPSRLYIVSDMEFDWCMENADITNFAYAKSLFAASGYKLPEVVFWNVNSRNRQQPVTRNEQGVALVSGCTPRLFGMVAQGIASPYTVMMDVLGSERYAPVSA